MGYVSRGSKWLRALASEERDESVDMQKAYISFILSCITDVEMRAARVRSAMGGGECKRLMCL